MESSNRQRDREVNVKDYKDVELVAGISGGSALCEEYLVWKYTAGLKSFFLRTLSDMPRAEDLAHETLLLVLQKLRRDGLENPDKLASYIYATARYVHIGWLRKKDNQLVFHENPDRWDRPTASPEQELMHGEAQVQLRQSIAKLPVERDREILKRHYLFEQTKDEICSALALSQVHYDKVICRARQRLRLCVSAEQGLAA
jgi:RNA polymerase sigma-70 factor (ECF subfamily)